MAGQLEEQQPQGPGQTGLRGQAEPVPRSSWLPRHPRPLGRLRERGIGPARRGTNLATCRNPRQPVLGGDAHRLQPLGGAYRNPGPQLRGRESAVGTREAEGQARADAGFNVISERRDCEGLSFQAFGQRARSSAEGTPGAEALALVVVDTGMPWHRPTRRRWAPRPGSHLGADPLPEPLPGPATPTEPTHLTCGNAIEAGSLPNRTSFGTKRSWVQIPPPRRWSEGLVCT